MLIKQNIASKKIFVVACLVCFIIIRKFLKPNTFFVQLFYRKLSNLQPGIKIFIFTSTRKYKICTYLYMLTYSYLFL